MRIAIDPGHGMSNRQAGIYDPGAIHVENGFRHEEATIALKYGLILKDILRAGGHDVFMTRDDAEDHAPVLQRAPNARGAGCDAFISLHLNDFEDDDANGLEVLYRANENLALAEKMQKALIEVTQFKDRKVKQRTDLAVLKFSGPCVLIELGFIANDSNREVLLNPQKRMAICQAIASIAVEHTRFRVAGV